MVNVVLKPQVGKLILTHPGTGELYFDNGKGEKIQGILHIVGTSSVEFRNAMKSIMPSSFVDFIQGKDDDTESRLMASCIVGWDDTGFILEPYSPQNAIDLIMDPQNLWIKVQVKKFIEDQSNFFYTPRTE